MPGYFKFCVFLIAGILIFSCRKSDYLVEDGAEVYTDNGTGTGTVTWTRDKQYLVEGFIYVNDGQTLTIEAGTVIRFKSGEAENASALIVARGGKIIAEGTRPEPIIFTSEDDDLQGEIADEARGLWGGLIILGNAPLNIEGNENSIEGLPLAEPRNFYGGDNETDNSGILKYVSIRHGGTNIGEGNEINGLTLGGVGSGTVIDYVEIISNEDDGIEIFGGTVNIKHLVVSGCGDDAFDYDLGWSGNGQFLLGVQSNGDNLIEAGGGVSPVNGLPFSLPKIYNATLIGGNSGIGYCVAFRNNAGGTIANSIFINKTNGISIESTDLAHDSYYQWKTGNLGVSNNLFFNVSDSPPESIFLLSGIYTPAQESELDGYFYSAQNEIADPGIDFSGNNFVPEEKIKGQLASYPQDWFQVVDFKGAFGEDNWIDGWTLLSAKSSD